MSDDLSRRIRNLQETFELGDIEQEAYEKGLNRLRVQYGGERVDAALKDLTPPNPTLDVSGAGGVGIVGDVEKSLINTGDHSKLIQSERDSYYVEGDLFIPAYPEQQALKNYLCTILRDYRALQMGQIDQKEAGFQEMHLEQVYVSLNITRQVEIEGKRDTRPLTAIEALNAPHPARLILLGAPGSGKSTLVNHLALCLIEAHLARYHPQPSQPDSPEQWLNRLPAWSHGPLIPIRIILRDFAEFEGIQKATTGKSEVFLNYLTKILGTHEQAKPFVETALNDGQAILLFDGLDEVVGEPTLSRVVETIQAVATTYRNAPVLVTCRILDYEANPRRQIPGFTRETLAELSDKQIAAFVQAWYAEIDRTGRKMLGNANGLQQAITTRPELYQLARLPLLLTMMAIVHAGKGELPHARALLYYECIDLLLCRWRQDPGKGDVLAKLKLPQFRERDLWTVMARLGFVVHSSVERSEGETSERAADLSGADVQRVLKEQFSPYAEGDDHRLGELVNTMLHAIATRNGLLLKRSNEQGEQYAFPHRSFQEFLAGYDLKSRSPYRGNCLKYTKAIHWHEVLRLMVGYQVLQDGELERPLDLAKELLERSALEQVLGGELLVLIGYERAEQVGLEPAPVWEKARERLMTIVTKGTAPEQAAPLRVRAAYALGEIGDPRIPVTDEQWRLANQPGNEPLSRYWCRIEAGDFWFGNDEKGEELKKVSLPYSFQIARYPLTYAQYARFIDAGGYDPSQPWWTEEGRKFILPGGHGQELVDFDNDKPITQPRLWNDSEYNKATQPVVGISWYEAVACSRWWTMQGHIQGWLPEGEEIRLPTSLEWERAARHTDRRRYPWGDENPRVEHANYNGTGIGEPTPVGCFAQGQAECGAMDMMGNVWEWTATPQGQDEDPCPHRDFAALDRVRLRDGSYHENIERLFCGSHNWYYARGWGDGGGVRFLRSLSSSEQ